MALFQRSLLLGFSLLLLLGTSGCSLIRGLFGPKLRDVEMVAVPGGAFLMGDLWEEENADALPLHYVQVNPFLMSKFETTYEQYDAFANRTGRPLPSDDGFGRGRRAVTNVSWDDALAFCQAYGYRLPTEEEWEYAARSGGGQEKYAGTERFNELREYAWFSGDSPGYTAEVGQKKPNGLGLYDMTGNAAEWVGEYYQFYPKPGESPQLSDMQTSGIRIVRGGGFHHYGELLTTYWRMGSVREVSTFTIGFRCAASADRP